MIMKVYLKPEIERIQVLTEQGFLTRNSPGRYVNAKQFHPATSYNWETEDEENGVSDWPKSKTLWDK